MKNIITIITIFNIITLLVTSHPTLSQNKKSNIIIQKRNHNDRRNKSSSNNNNDDDKRKDQTEEYYEEYPSSSSSSKSPFVYVDIPEEHYGDPIPHEIDLPYGNQDYPDHTIEDELPLPQTTWDAGVFLIIHTLTIANAVLGCIFLLSGITLCFFGSKSMRFTVFWVGFYDMAVLVFLVMTFMIYKNGPWSSQDMVYTIAILLFGLVGSFLTFTFTWLAVLLLGGMFGYVCGMLLLVVGLGTLIASSTAGMVCYYLVWVALGGTFVFFHEGFVIVGATAFCGSLGIFLGLDVFIGSGFVEVISASMTGLTKVLYYEDWLGEPTIALLMGNVPLIRVPPYAWALFSGVFIIAAFGATVQRLPQKEKAINKKKKESGGSSSIHHSTAPSSSSVATKIKKAAGGGKSSKKEEQPFSLWPWANGSSSSSSSSGSNTPKETHHNIGKNGTKSWFKGEMGSGWKPK